MSSLLKTGSAALAILFLSCTCLNASENETEPKTDPPKQSPQANNPVDQILRQLDEGKFDSLPEAARNAMRKALKEHSDHVSRFRVMGKGMIIKPDGNVETFETDDIDVLEGNHIPEMIRKRMQQAQKQMRNHMQNQLQNMERRMKWLDELGNEVEVESSVKGRIVTIGPDGETKIIEFPDSNTEEEIEEVETIEEDENVEPNVKKSIRRRSVESRDDVAGKLDLILKRLEKIESEIEKLKSNRPNNG